MGDAGLMEPETCSPLGDFPPPALLPNISSAQEGNLVLARCLVFSHLPITHIFFCKNGVVLENHPVGPKEFTATLTIRLSAESSGTYSCGYRRQSNVGHIKISSLSIPWLLTIEGRKGELRNSSSSTATTTPELPAEDRKTSPAGQLEAFHSSPSGRAQRFTEEESSRISCIWMTSCWTTDVLLDVNIAALNGHSRGNWPKTASLRLNTSCSA
ncbi:uncharacterized protein LOC427029 isoform X3 [Gallus gallus]|uniref:uncharacterized protein LOC427029 isoform X3 n=1 Tax=Gallus gallus TaxID=9031 RepID=UPI001AE6B2B5|nr:uncharacterized protein LOC427029 isoform X3 [Gallus gallus]